MGEITAIGGEGRVRAAIARAAQATGIDFDYLLAQAKLESNLNPAARARTSSATGLYQFLGATWLDTLDRHGAEHGLGWAADAIARSGKGAAVGDPVLRAQIMALRLDPETSALMAAELAGDNRASLVASLGREPDPAELYLAHFLGADGAGRFLDALGRNPGQAAAAIVPDAAAANRAIFYANGAPRSLTEVMDLLRGRLNGAMEGRSAEEWATAAPGPGAGALGPVAREFQARAAQPLPDGQTRPAMSETLSQLFAMRGGEPPAGIRAAYGRLRSMGL